MYLYSYVITRDYGFAPNPFWVGNYYEMGQHGLPYKWKKFGQFVRFEGEKQ